MRGATRVSLQLQQILRLPRKMNLTIDALHTWNVIYNAGSNTCHCPTSPNTAPATKNDSHHWSLSHMKRYLQCAEQVSKLTKYCTMINPLHTWNAIYNARSKKCHCPNSPNTAPATKNESHDWSLSQVKRYLQCAEQHVSLSKLTKYCACHEKWLPWLILVTHETLFTMRRATCVIVQTHQILRLPRKMTVQNLREICWKRMKRHLQCAADPSMIRPWSEHETVSPQPASQPRLLFTPTTRILYWKIQHFALRLPFQISPNTAPATKSDTWTSPNTAPATKSNTHHWSSSHMKRYLQCAEQQ